MNSANPDVSVIIVSFNTREVLRECLTTLMREAGDVAYQAIVVDNASRDGSADMVESEFPKARLVRNSVNLGFAAANNRGFDLAQGRYVVLLNSDAFLRPGALALSLEKMEVSPRVGLGGARLVGRDDSWQPSARMFPSITRDFLTLSGLASKYPRSAFFGRFDRTWSDASQPAEVDWVPGAYSIIRREVLDLVGGFDENFFLYYEEVDLCRRIKRAGYSVWYWPEIVIVHVGGESSRTLSHLSLSAAGSQLTLWRMRSALLYYRKHHGARAAWLAKEVESIWHTVRRSKNGRSSDPERQEKARASAAIVAMMDMAWRETQGGRVSPPRPW